MYSYFSKSSLSMFIFMCNALIIACSKIIWGFYELLGNMHEHATSWIVDIVRNFHVFIITSTGAKWTGAHQALESFSSVLTDMILKIGRGRETLATLWTAVRKDTSMTTQVLFVSIRWRKGFVAFNAVQHASCLQRQNSLHGIEHRKENLHTPSSDVYTSTHSTIITTYPDRFHGNMVFHFMMFVNVEVISCNSHCRLSYICTYIIRRRLMFVQYSVHNTCWFIGVSIASVLVFTEGPRISYMGDQSANWQI